MTIESQNQILSPKDRLSAQKEADFKSRNSSQISTEFEAYVFCNPVTEMSMFFKCRVYPVGGADSDQREQSFQSPLDTKTEQEYRHAINRCPQGLIRGDHPEIAMLQNGSVWKCHRKGNVIQIESLVKSSGFDFIPGQGVQKSDGAMGAFMNGAKQPVLTEKRIDNAEIKLEASTDLQAQLNRYSHFRNFFEEFRKRLRTTSFTGTSIKVNSLYRDGIGQARAMVKNRFKGDAASLAYFRNWYLKTYTSAKSDKEIYNTIFGTEWKDPAKLQNALGVIYQKRIDAGYYKNKNSHSSLRSIDMNTNKQPYSNVIIMLEVLESMKKDGIVKYYNWEEVWDHVKGNKEPGLAKRRTQGVFQSNEHIHLGLVSGPHEGE